MRKAYNEGDVGTFLRNKFSIPHSSYHSPLDRLPDFTKMHFIQASTVAMALMAASAVVADDSVSSSSLAARSWWPWSSSPSSNTYGSSLASQTCYGASGKPWDSTGTPGWYIGSGSAGNIPKWDSGDSRWCANSRYAHNSFCKKGNPTAKAPTNSSRCWGASGKAGWPRPKANGGSKASVSSASTSSSSSSASLSSVASTGSCAVSTQTIVLQASTVTVTATQDGTVVTSLVPTTVTSTLTDTTTATATTTATTTTTAVVPTGTPEAICNDQYQKVFKNLTTIADSGVYKGQVVGVAIVSNTYLTYGLADTAEQCLQICDDVDGCVFVNSYLDVEEDDADDPRHSGKYTCALYSTCAGVDKATNFGGQNDPNYISDSTGWCKTDYCKSS